MMLSKTGRMSVSSENITKADNLLASRTLTKP